MVDVDGTDLVSQLREEIARLRAERDDLLTEAAAGRDALLALAATVRERDRMAELLSRTQDRLDTAETTLDGLVGSTSWRLTAPMRRLSERRRAGRRTPP